MTKGEKCENCRFFYLDEYVSADEIEEKKTEFLAMNLTDEVWWVEGECHRRSPEQYWTCEQLRSKFADTRSDRWCGEWAPKG